MTTKKFSFLLLTTLILITQTQNNILDKINNHGNSSNLLPILNNQNFNYPEEKILNLKFLENSYENNSTTIKEQLEIPSYYSNKTHPENFSKILNLDDYKLFRKWFKKNYTLNFLYSTEIFDDTTYKFHEICDGKQNVLVIIQAENGRKFGGFNSLGWNVKLDDFTRGKGKEFLYSLNYKRRIKNCRKRYAIYNRDWCGPCFGDGIDLMIANEATKNSHSYSNLGFSYGEWEMFDEEKHLYLAGSFHFKVKLYEVFIVEFN